MISAASLRSGTVWADAYGVVNPTTRQMAIKPSRTRLKGDKPCSVDVCMTVRWFAVSTKLCDPSHELVMARARACGSLGIVPATKDALHIRMRCISACQKGTSPNPLYTTCTTSKLRETRSHSSVVLPYLEPASGSN